MPKLSKKEVRNEIVESEPNHFEVVSEVEYRRSNGLLRISCGEKVHHPDKPHRFRQPILKVEFTTNDGSGNLLTLDILKEFGLPDDWTLMFANDSPNPAEAFPEEKTILLAEKLNEIIAQQVINNQSEFDSQQEKVATGNYGFDARIAFNQSSRSLMVYKQKDYFDSQSSFLMLAHEISHAKTYYPPEDIEKREQFKEMRRENFNKTDLDDYKRLVVDDEYQRNKEALGSLAELKNRGINLEDEMSETELIEQAFGALWSYEQKLYPNMAKLKELVNEFCDGLERVISIEQQDVFSEALWQYIQKNGLDKPKFKFLYGQRAKEYLINNNLVADYQSAPDAILVFDLPKPLSYWWWKGDRTIEPRINLRNWQPSENSKNNISKWGSIYHQKLPRVWNLRDFLDDFAELYEGFDDTENRFSWLAEQFKEFDGFGIRINNRGQHDSLNYYYVWGWWLTNKPRESYI